MPGQATWLHHLRLLNFMKEQTLWVSPFLEYDSFIGSNQLVRYQITFIFKGVRSLVVEGKRTNQWWSSFLYWQWRIGWTKDYLTLNHQFSSLLPFFVYFLSLSLSSWWFIFLVVANLFLLFFTNFVFSILQHDFNESNLLFGSLDISEWYLNI